MEDDLHVSDDDGSTCGADRYDMIRRHVISIIHAEKGEIHPFDCWATDAGLDEAFLEKGTLDRERTIKQYLRAWWEHLAGLDDSAAPGEGNFDRAVRVLEDNSMKEHSPLRMAQIRMDPKHSLDTLDERNNDILLRLGGLNDRAHTAGMVWMPSSNAGECGPTESDAQAEIRSTFGRIAEMIRSSANLVQARIECEVLKDDALEVQRDDIKLVHFFRNKQPARPDDIQTLLHYVMDQAHRQKLRRYGDSVYRMKTTQIECERVLPGNKREKYIQTVDTHAWVRFVEMRKFIYDICSHTYAENMWEVLHSQKSGNYVERLLTYFEYSDKDDLFPVLDREQMRNCHSFRDGVYCGKTDTFYPYDESRGQPPPSSVVSCKFIDSEFMQRESSEDRDDDPGYNFWESGIPDPDEWYDLPTPALQSIFDSQKFWDPSSTDAEARQQSHQQVCRMLYVLLGRLLYRLGEMDKWQVILFVKGVAGSGKSTLGQMVKMWFDPSDVGILSNNAQTTFALADICDKQIYLCFEVKSTFKVDQADLQSMISRDVVAVNRKHKSALTMEWDIPGMLMGNENGPWINSAGSITRRMAYVNFSEKPTAPNPNLLEEIKAELPMILLKCNRAYRWAVRTYGPRRDIWDFLPRYFMSMQDAMKESTSPITSFLLNCIELEFGRDYAVPMQELSQLFRRFCQQNGFDSRMTQWNEDMYSSAFKECKPDPLRVEDTERQHDGKTLRTKFVCGVRIVPLGGGTPDSGAADFFVS